MDSAPQGVLLINLGTPDAPETGAVRRYLREFLSDPRVLDIPPVGRAALLYGAILPFRPQRSAEAYRKIWMPEGSPLLVHGNALARSPRGCAGPRVGGGARDALRQTVRSARRSRSCVPAGCAS